MAGSSPWLAVEQGPIDLRQLTRSWFLFLSTCRRQAQAMPADPQWMRDKLQGLLADMERRAKVDPRLEASLREAKYPLVYLADEILLSCHWAGEAAWAADLLETRCFGTQHAGQDFFVRLDQALERDDAGLHEVYFKCLCLGFRGRLVKQPEALQNMRRDLFRRLPAERLSGARFCPETYENTDERSFVKLPIVAAARIVIVLVALLLGIFVVANYTFQSRLEELNRLAIEETTPAKTE